MKYVKVTSHYKNGGKDGRFIWSILDFNHQGVLDKFEHAAELTVFASMMGKEEKKTKLEKARLDINEIKFMDS